MKKSLSFSVLRDVAFVNAQAFVSLTLGALIMVFTFVLFFAPTNIALGGLRALCLLLRITSLLLQGLPNIP